MEAQSVAAPPAPNFLIIGAQKSATRWLRHNLGKHPDVFTAEDELHFFNDEPRFRDFGVEWYRSQFAGWNGERFVGESTPGYMMRRHWPAVVARRIHETLPDVRLIAIVRDPTERAQSALAHHVRHHRLPPDADVLDVARDAVASGHDRYGIIEGGLYARSLRPYLETFGEQLLVLVYDDVRTRPERVYRRALAHIGADPGFVPEGLRDIVFNNQSVRGGHRRLSLDEREELYEYFADDIANLSAMFSLNLSRWEVHASKSELARRFGPLYEQVAAWGVRVLAHVDTVMPASMSERGAELRAMAFDFVQETEYFLAMFTDSPAEALDKDSEAVRAELVSRYTTAAEALRQEFTKPSTYKRRVETVFRSMNGDEFAAAVVVRQMTAIWSLACESGHDATVPEGLRLLGMRYAHRLLERGFAAGDERLVAFVRAND